jgi:hypothetical protein
LTATPLTVYDLTIADAHEFYANGILVHNCDFCAPMQGKIIGIDDAYFGKGSVFTTPSLTTGKPVSIRLNYEDVVGPPMHPQCRCSLMPVIPDEGIEPEPGPEEAQVQTGTNILQGLKDSGVDVAWESVDDIIDAQWRAYSQSGDLTTSIQREMQGRRHSVRTAIARDVLESLRGMDLTVEERHARLDAAIDAELERLRPEIAAEIEEAFFANWARKYERDNPIIADARELSAIASGLRNALNAERAGQDAVYIIRNPIGELEAARSGVHEQGQIVLYNQSYVEVGVLDEEGQNIAGGDFYGLRHLGEELTIAPFTYQNYYEGVATHEYGHAEANADPDIEMRASQAIDQLGPKEIDSLISKYAFTNPGEAAAEAYTLYKHPDYSALSPRARAVIEYILLGKGTIE